MDKIEAINSKLQAYCEEHSLQLTEENLFSICKKALTKEEYEVCFLSDDFSDAIDKLAAKGDQLFEQQEYKAAIKIYKQGIAIIPEPKDDWETKLWFTAAIADAYWYMKDYQKALQYLNESVEVEGGEENPFVRLRRGQVYLELSLPKKAKRELRIAHGLGGDDLFEDEKEKYFKVLSGRR